MLGHSDAYKIYQQINTATQEGLKVVLFKSALRYASLRFEWKFLSQEERLTAGEERTRAHNAFISHCDALARNMKVAGQTDQWRQLLGNDRKLIGDLACWIAAFVGLENR